MQRNVLVCGAVTTQMMIEAAPGSPPTGDQPGGDGQPGDQPGDGGGGDEDEGYDESDAPCLAGAETLLVDERVEDCRHDEAGITTC